MDDPTLSRLRASVRLQRVYEHNRLEKQFLIDAYECLVAIIEDDSVGGHAADKQGSMTKDRNEKRGLVHNRPTCPGGSS
jgi:hypothetical protein